MSLGVSLSWDVRTETAGTPSDTELVNVRGGWVGRGSMCKGPGAGAQDGEGGQ